MRRCGSRAKALKRGESRLKQRHGEVEGRPVASSRLWILALLLDCATDTPNPAVNSIEITHRLPNDFVVASSIAKLRCMIDEPDGGATLYTDTPSSVTGVTRDGFPYTVTVGDPDVDGKKEVFIDFVGSPFDGGLTWKLLLEESSTLSPSVVRGFVYQHTTGGQDYTYHIWSGSHE